MQITDTIHWLTVANWPSTGANPATYAVFQGASATPIAGLAAVSGTDVAVTYDDAQGAVFVVRPVQTVGQTTSYGPAQSVCVGPVPLTSRAAVRAYVRKAMNDRTDTGADASYVPKVADSELDEYLGDAIRRFSSLFPRTAAVALPIAYQQRTYTLPADFLRVLEAKYTSTLINSFVYYLKEEPFKPGETTADSFMGNPKLGIYAQIASGRYYRGHFWIDQSTTPPTITVDFDPDVGDGCTLTYAATHVTPTDDATPMDVDPTIVEGLCLYVQAKAWLQIESSDVSLSRWDRGQGGNARRDDMPTEKMSNRMFNAWNQWLEQQRSVRPRTLRLYRRT